MSEDKLIAAMAHIVSTKAQHTSTDITTNMATMFNIQQQDALQRGGAIKDDIVGIKVP